jgi:hypothetical protein
MNDIKSKNIMITQAMKDLTCLECLEYCLFSQIMSVGSEAYSTSISSPKNFIYGIVLYSRAILTPSSSAKVQKTATGN